MKLAPSPTQEIRQEVAAPAKEAKQAKGFSDRESAIKKRKWRFNQILDFLKQGHTLSDRAIDVWYEGYASIPNLSASTVMLQGWLGAGKTEAAIRSVLDTAKKRPVVWVVPRNGVGRQTEKRLERAITEAMLEGVAVYHYQDGVGDHKNYLRNGEPGIYVMAYASFRDHSDEHFRWDRIGLLVVDEFNNVRSEIPGQREPFKNFQRALAEAEKLLVIDAFLSDHDYAILAKYRDMGDAKIYRQRFQKSKTPITILQTVTSGDKPEIALSHEGLHLAFLRKQLKRKRGKFCIATDNKSTAWILTRFLESLGLKVLLVSADTPEQSIPFMTSPDERWAEGGYDALVYTPTAQSGLDVQSHFDWGYLICSGVISPIQMLQMLGRCRQCKHWYASAEMRSWEPTGATSNLSNQKIRNSSYKFKSSLSQLDLDYQEPSIGWQLLQDAVKDAESSFNAEVVESLLHHFFENVSTEIVREPEVSEFRQLRKQVKSDQSVQTMLSDLDRGRELNSAQKEAATNEDVWSKRLAALLDNYPTLEPIVEEFRAVKGETEDDQRKRDELVEIFQLFASSRNGKLKTWCIAQDQVVLEGIRANLATGKIASNSALFRAYRNALLFAELKLQRLAAIAGYEDKEVILHETHFTVQSPIVGQLWEQFQQLEVSKLFPLVDTISDFWAAVRRCMSATGYRSAGKRVRVKSGEPVANGQRNGRTRYANSKVTYFSAWYVMEMSGSKLFQQWFPEIIKAVEAIVTKEHEVRISRLVKGGDPVADYEPQAGTSKRTIRIKPNAPPGYPSVGCYSVQETKADGSVRIDSPTFIKWVVPTFFEEVA